MADARRAGLRADEIRSAVSSGAWHRLRRGVFTPASRWAAADDDRARHLLAAAAALAVLGSGPVLSHSSAARFHGFVLPHRADDVVRLTHADQWRTGRGYRVAAASLPAGDVLRTGDLPVTGAARTLVDCAREWALTDAVVAIDAAIQEKRVRRADLVAAVLQQSHWLGIGAAARALDLSDGRAESPLETLGRLALQDAGLPRPELQVELHGPRGFVARVDAWYDDAGIAVEFDGQIKYRDPRGGRTPAEVAWKEKRREDQVRDLDARVVRVVQKDLPRLDAPAGRIRELMARPAPGPRRYRVVRAPEPDGNPDDAAA
ncbi:Transcriptional regulator, AbiEi antitoxin, Type IV TA system [Trujillonella endophytica]|uniref:Transcriptional regulator, AbiEi antitoxin, Type IV TA system n=1 Tax=Trujillonella endophytica TaxID=673521 RepID=A0A1H8WR45_9ACTN|nr:Transcriptional regulator, AbiEi antitoxin, Type IV TA system [Trujillella endophytica]